MSEKKDIVYLFDLDSTITKEEILPTISKIIGRYEEMRNLTEITMRGEMPFHQSFLARIEILKDISVSYIQELISNISVHDSLVEFMKRNKNNCYIVTGNLDCWISKLMNKIGMDNNCYCSKANVENDRIVDVISVIDKNNVDEWFKDKIIVAVGDGNNDAEMIAKADIGIGFGGVRKVAPAVLENATHVICDEITLCKFLENIERGNL